MKIFLKCLTVLCTNFSKCHCIQQWSPYWIASNPSLQSVLNCFLFILWVVTIACFNLLRIKFESFKQCSALAWCISAHMLSQELKMILEPCNSVKYRVVTQQAWKWVTPYYTLLPIELYHMYSTPQWSKIMNCFTQYIMTIIRTHCIIFPKALGAYHYYHMYIMYNTMYKMYGNMLS